MKRGRLLLFIFCLILLAGFVSADDSRYTAIDSFSGTYQSWWVENADGKDTGWKVTYQPLGGGIGNAAQELNIAINSQASITWRDLYTDGGNDNLKIIRGPENSPSNTHVFFWVGYHINWIGTGGTEYVRLYECYRGSCRLKYSRSDVWGCSGTLFGTCWGETYNLNSWTIGGDLIVADLACSPFSTPSNDCQGFSYINSYTICTSDSQKICSNNDVYWGSGCNNYNTFIQDCGVDSYSSNYCSNDDIFRDFTDRGCNPIPYAACFVNAPVPQLVSDCGVDSYSSNYCSNDDIFRDLIDRGCSSGLCFSTSIPQFLTDCDDGLYCNGVETCIGAVCGFGTLINCNDNIACTTDSCNEASNSCLHNDNCGSGFFCNTVTGDCQATCTDECSIPTIQKQCFNSTRTQERSCGNFDADSCLDWSSWQYLNCEAGQTCNVASGTCQATCIDDCTLLETQRDCLDIDTRRTRSCGNFDADSCLEFGTWQNFDCANNEQCASGNCEPLPPVCACSDGTACGDCSLTKPRYCNASGSLIEKCSQCGCSSGNCLGNESCGSDIISINDCSDYTELGQVACESDSFHVAELTVESANPFISCGDDDGDGCFINCECSWNDDVCDGSWNATGTCEGGEGSCDYLSTTLKDCDKPPQEGFRIVSISKNWTGDPYSKFAPGCTGTEDITRKCLSYVSLNFINTNTIIAVVVILIVFYIIFRRKPRKRTKKR